MRRRSAPGFQLGQKLLQRLPVIASPSFREMLSSARRKPRVVKNDLASGALLDEFKPGDGIDPRFPVDLTPRLNDPLIRHQFDVAADDISAEQLERATHLTANLCRLGCRRHSGAHGLTEQRDLMELLRISQCLVKTLLTRLENGLLMNGLR